MKMINDSDRIQNFIANHQLNHVFDPTMQTQLELHSFEADEQLIYAEDEVQYLYLVLEGEARVAPTSTDGKAGFLEYILPMDVVGDMEYFTSSRYFHNVVALTPCTYLAIPTASIESHFSHNISFYRFICQNMAAKMKRTSTRYSKSILYPLKNRLAEFLLDLRSQQQSDQLIVISDQAADYLGVTTRHYRRILLDLEKEHILIRKKENITLLNPAALEHLSQVMK